MAIQKTDRGSKFFKGQDWMGEYALIVEPIRDSLQDEQDGKFVDNNGNVQRERRCDAYITPVRSDASLGQTATVTFSKPMHGNLMADLLQVDPDDEAPAGLYMVIELAPKNGRVRGAIVLNDLPSERVAVATRAYEQLCAGRALGGVATPL